MNQISLWSTALGSMLFAVVVCIDSQKWELLIDYAIAMTVWMIVGWFWAHREDLEYDLELLASCESPMKCRWMGTLVFCIIVVLIVVGIIIGTLWFVVMQVIKVLN